MPRRFLRGLIRGLLVVWPVMLYLLSVIFLLGIVVALREGWTTADGMYFAMVTALTVGYGDLTPKSLLGRLLALIIGVHGIVFTGVIVAVAVSSLRGVLVSIHGNLDKFNE